MHVFNALTEDKPLNSGFDLNELETSFGRMAQTSF